MDDNKNSDDELIRNLQDAGMSANGIQDFMKCYSGGQPQEWMRILNKQRSTLLTDVHVGQEKLYCLDYLIRKLKSQESKIQGV